MTSRKCGQCHVVGHTAKTCPKDPWACTRIMVPAEAAEIALERVRPLLRAVSYEKNILDALMLACYLQGALDAQDPRFRQIVDARSA